jgi:hypothetical protein
MRSMTISQRSKKFKPSRWTPWKSIYPEGLSVIEIFTKCLTNFLHSLLLVGCIGSVVYNRYITIA